MSSAEERREAFEVRQYGGRLQDMDLDELLTRAVRHMDSTTAREDLDLYLIETALHRASEA